MTRRVVVRPRANRDLVQFANYIAKDDLSAAERLLDAFEETTNLLQVTPTRQSRCFARSGSCPTVVCAGRIS